MRRSQLTVGPKQNPAVLRAPTGNFADSQKFWSLGKPTYDPAKITVPIFLIQAEWDQDAPPYMARTLFSLLANAPEKRCFMPSALIQVRHWQRRLSKALSLAPHAIGGRIGP